MNYVSSPNKINTLNHHIGTMYQLETDLGDRKWYNRLNPAWYTLNTHSMDKIVDYFFDNIAEDRQPLAISDWPVSDIKDWPDFIKSKKSKQQKKYLEYAKFDEEGKCYRVSIKDEANKLLFDLTYEAHYQMYDDYNPRLAIPLRHFNQEMQLFLQTFYTSFAKILRSEDDVQKLIRQFARSDVPEEIANYLINFRLVDDKAGNLIVHFVGEDMEDVYRFRNRLSWYLQDTSNVKAIEKAIAALDEGRSRLELNMTLVAKGARVEEISNVHMIGLDFSMHGVNDEDKIKLHREQQAKLYQDIADINSKVNIVLIKEGAVVGTFKDSSATGINIAVYGDDPADNKGDDFEWHDEL